MRRTLASKTATASSGTSARRPLSALKTASARSSDKPPALAAPGCQRLRHQATAASASKGTATHGNGTAVIAPKTASVIAPSCGCGGPPRFSYGVLMQLGRQWQNGQISAPLLMTLEQLMHLMAISPG